MRHGQSRLVDHAVSVQNQIEIECSRRANVWPLASESLLDGLQCIEDRARRELRLACRRSVQKHRLRSWHIDRSGFVERRNTQACERRSERRDSDSQLRLAI